MKAIELSYGSQISSHNSHFYKLNVNPQHWQQQQHCSAAKGSVTRRSLKSYELKHVSHLLYKFTFVEAFPQQLFLNDTSVGSVWISNLFLNTEHKHNITINWTTKYTALILLYNQANSNIIFKSTCRRNISLRNPCRCSRNPHSPCRRWRWSMPISERKRTSESGRRTCGSHYAIIQ